MALKIGIRGLFGPKLPRKLGKLSSAQAWGEKFGAKWGDEYGNLSGRYKLLDERVPALTDRYLRKKMELGNRLARLEENKKWKEEAKSTFDSIVSIRKEPLYPVAMFPFQILKTERRAANAKKAADKMAKNLMDASAFYSKAVAGIQADEKRLEDYGKKLHEFRMGIVRAKEMQSLTGGKAVEVRELLSDVDRMTKHISAARTYLDTVRSEILQRMSIAAAASGRRRSWEL